MTSIFQLLRIKEPKYLDDLKTIRLFMENVRYQEYLQEIKDSKRQRLAIDLGDIEEFFKNNVLTKKIELNSQRYVELFTEICDELLLELDRTVIPNFQDMITHYETKYENEMKDDGEKPTIPKGLIRRYVINFKPRRKMLGLKLRRVRSDHIGKLVRTRGIVCRISDVKCEVKYACFYCDNCVHEEFVEVKDVKSFMPKFECKTCKRNKTFGTMELSTRGSKFARFQEIIFQEIPSEVPRGSVPRKVKVRIHGVLTRKCSPGDEILLTGVFLQDPVNSYKPNTYLVGTYLEAHDIVLVKRRYKDMIYDNNMMLEIKNFVEKESLKTLYEKLAKSIAPEIHGMLDVKKALLLMLVGGVNKTLGSGVKIRGDLNVCLIGDPGVAKSQLLKYITKLSPRGVYTTGRGSSAVGLTAAVVRDRLTKEFVLEGGALVLADRGVCCIDEFDKMNDKDVTALHEVMEQQSISIAKAGIATTLNARASLLVAANPQYGCYDKKKSVVENIDMPSALLSRFDLIFLILDQKNRDSNISLAKHILGVWINKGIKKIGENGENEYLSQHFLRSFIAKAKTYTPYIPKDLKKFIVDMYTALRSVQGTDEIYGSTPRTLLTILRLSQALAKLRFDKVVNSEDVKEAKRLMDSCKSSLIENYDSTKSKKYNPTDIVFNLLKAHYRETKNPNIKMDDVAPKFQAAGLSKPDVMKAITEYSDLCIISFDEETNTISLIN